MSIAEQNFDSLTARIKFIEYRMELSKSNCEYAVAKAYADRDVAYAIDSAELDEVKEARREAKEAYRIEQAQLTAAQDEEPVSNHFCVTGCECWTDGDRGTQEEYAWWLHDENEEDEDAS